MLERTLQKKIMAALRKRGWGVWKVASEGRRGFPDLFCVRNGRVVLGEVKTPVGVVSAMQQETIRELTNYECDVYIWRSVKDAVRDTEEGR